MVQHDVHAQACSRGEGGGPPPQPPIFTMARFLVPASSIMPAWAARLRSTAADTTAARSPSLAPWRIASRRLTSLAPNRQTLRLPSAISRRRLQSEQKALVMDVMKLTLPWKPGTYR